MDENYLDNLLNEISLDAEIDHNIENELDNQMSEEKRRRQAENSLSQEEMFDLGLNEDIIGSDDPLDLDFSEEQMDELDHLDHLADLDIGDLDFSDIDFDDVDVTKLDDIGNGEFDDILKEFEGNLEVDTLFDSSKKEDTENTRKEQPQETDSPVFETNDNLNEDSFNANAFLDSLLEESEQDADNSPVTELPEEEGALQQNEIPDADQDEQMPDLDALLGEMPDTQAETSKDAVSEEENTEGPLGDEADADITDMGAGILEQDDLDDLLSMLDAQENSGALSSEHVDEELDVDQQIGIMDDTEDMEDSKEVASAKKKKSLMEIIFGEPDEDDELSEEELAAIEEKKAAKKAKKEAAKAEKEQKKEEAKEKKAFNNSQKQQNSEEKKRVKAEKKAKRKAEEAANAEPEKKLNRPAVIFIFTLFLGGVFLFVVFTTDFNYKQAIGKATEYFASQKYHRAYDEIKGVEVKEGDKELKARIYTVMYVERLYEAYETNLSMHREEKALDSLLRGVSKYYEHYEEAKELGIASDIDFSFSQIQNALMSRYGISIEQAVQLNGLENWEYAKQITTFASSVAPVEEEMQEEEEDMSEDAALPEEEQ